MWLYVVRLGVEACSRSFFFSNITLFFNTTLFVVVVCGLQYSGAFLRTHAW